MHLSKVTRRLHGTIVTTEHRSGIASQKSHCILDQSRLRWMLIGRSKHDLGVYQCEFFSDDISLTGLFILRCFSYDIDCICPLNGLLCLIHKIEIKKPSFQFIVFNLLLILNVETVETFVFCIYFCEYDLNFFICNRN